MRIKQADGTFIEVTPQIDWNQNDNKANGYIENRTHYTISTTEAEPIYANSALSIDQNHTTFYSTSFFDCQYSEDAQNAFVYKVIWDGVEYICNVKTVSDSMYSTYILLNPYTKKLGNESITILDGENTGEPFFMYMDQENGGLRIDTYDDSGQKQSVHSVTIIPILEEVKTLDEKYIPQSIARLSTVSEYIEYIDCVMNEGFDDVYEYIDENIFSGDYNDLVNTPIKDSRNREEFYYTFDGDVTSYETLTPDDFEGMEYAQSYAGGNALLVRISDSCPPVNNIYGDIELGVLEGEDSSTVSFSEKNIAEIWVGTFAIYEILWFIPNDIGNIKQGIYVLYVDEEYYVNSVRFMASYTGEFIQLDNKYLQDHITIGTRSEEDVEPLSENGVSTFDMVMMGAGDYSLTVGLENKAESSSMAIGVRNEATGECSFASGNMSKATGEFSYAGGINTESSGWSTHAEGGNTTASGYCSHAEGYYAEARGEASHAEGYATIASGKYQHAQGRYNIEDTENKYAHIVGNGKNDSSTGWKDVRSNAHTLDWEGNAWFAGKVTAGVAPSEDMDLTTKKYVDEKLPTIISEEVVFTLSQADLQAALDSHNREEGGCYIAVDKFPIEDGKNYYMTLNGKEYQPNFIYTTEPYTELYFDHCADDSEDKTSINFYGNYANDDWDEDINKILIEMHYDIDINTDLSIITREVKALDNKMLDRDLIIENSLSMNRNGSIGTYSTAIGYGCQASGFISHAEGDQTIACDICSHAEGRQTIASGPYSHAEGSHTRALGYD